MKFSKGQSGNPKGRPIGGVKKIDKIIIGSKEYNVVLAKLFEAINKQEAWSYEIFFKNLSPRIEQEMLMLEIEQGNPDKIEAITQGLLEAFSQLKAISFNEGCNLLSTLNYLRLKDGISKEQSCVKCFLNEKQCETLELCFRKTET